MSCRPFRSSCVSARQAPTPSSSVVCRLPRTSAPSSPAQAGTTTAAPKDARIRPLAVAPRRPARRRRTPAATGSTTPAGSTTPTRPRPPPPHLTPVHGEPARTGSSFPVPTSEADVQQAHLCPAAAAAGRLSNMDCNDDQHPERHGAVLHRLRDARRASRSPTCSGNVIVPGSRSPARRAGTEPQPGQTEWTVQLEPQGQRAGRVGQLHRRPQHRQQHRAARRRCSSAPRRHAVRRLRRLRPRRPDHLRPGERDAINGGRRPRSPATSPSPRRTSWPTS